MKTKLFLLPCAVVLIVACKKNTVTQTNNSSIKGTWELRATRNGNIIPATYPPGNGHLLVFGNSAFIEYIAGSIVDSGRYTKSADSLYKYTVFSTSFVTPFVNHISFKQDTLELKPTQPDLSTGFYVRKSE